MSDREEWYSNKDLFELIQHMGKDFSGLRSEMRETRNVIKKYNGLREEIGEMNKELNNVKKKMDNLQAEKKGKKSVGEAIHKWGGWLFALITLIVLIITKF